jgi:hypothetical protein
MATTFIARVFASLDDFDKTLARLATSLGGVAAAASVGGDELEQMQEAAVRAGAASTKLRRSFDLIQQTSLDIVDMQVRVQGETAMLAGSLNALGGMLQRVKEREQQGGQQRLSPQVEQAAVELEEKASLVAAAIFPGAIGGIRKVNVKLWDFDKLLWKRYTDLLTELVQNRKLTADQQATIERIADGIRDGFDRVNQLLNTLAEGAFIDSPMVVGEVNAARRVLATHLQEARERMTSAVEMFNSIVDEAADIADDVDEMLGDLRIPIFPPHDRLPLASSIDRALYENLTGVQRFAFMNIAARMLATRVGGQPLWAPEYEIRVTHVFPARIYFRAKPTLIDRVGGDSAQFTKAPASLHRFRDGSFKQASFAKGNLQLSFAKRDDGDMNVDADIDLFKSTIKHLFGEVLVNHLTGKTTDQFEVRDILDEQGVETVAGFSILTPTVALA